MSKPKTLEEIASELQSKLVQARIARAIALIPADVRIRLIALAERDKENENGDRNERSECSKEGSD